jgi:hypothetical protein
MLRRTLAVVGALAFALVPAACGDDDDASTRAETMSSQPSTTMSRPDDEQADAACGVTLAEVQTLLPAGSGVTENSTPDPGRCNFTWDDDGPRGIDVAIVAGGRSSFEVPVGYEPLDDLGNEAFVSTTAGRASAFAYAGDDLYAADVVADGAAEAELRALCLQLLELALA